METGTFVEIKATHCFEPTDLNRYHPRNRLHNNTRGFDSSMDPTDEQAGAWTEAFDAGKFVRKSSEFRDHIGADGTFDVESGQLSPFVV
jgi:hypothetical protein